MISKWVLEILSLTKVCIYDDASPDFPSTLVNFARALRNGRGHGQPIHVWHNFDLY
jgi:hypothetical protein